MYVIIIGIVSLRCLIYVSFPQTQIILLRLIILFKLIGVTFIGSLKVRVPCLPLSPWNYYRQQLTDLITFEAEVCTQVS